MKKHFLLLFTACFVCLPLCGCTNSFDCSGYIESMLDATYKGEFDDYAEFTGASTQELEADYEEFITHEADVLLQFCGITQEDVIPVELEEEMNELARTLCSEVQYTVDDSDLGGNVSVTIESLDIYNTTYDEIYACVQEFVENNNSYAYEDYTDEEFTEAYLEPLIEILQEYEEDPTYLDATTITVSVYQDEDGAYTISEEDLSSLYNALINYTLSDPQ